MQSNLFAHRLKQSMKDKNLKQIDIFTLSTALKGETEEVAGCFFRNLSSRLRYIIQEDMEYTGAVRLCEIEEAQEKIHNIITGF